MVSFSCSKLKVTGGLAAWASGLVVSVVVVLMRVMMQIHAHRVGPSSVDSGRRPIRVDPLNSGVTTGTPACYAGPPENLERSSRQRDWTAASRGAGTRAREAIPPMYRPGQ